MKARGIMSSNFRQGAKAFHIVHNGGMCLEHRRRDKINMTPKKGDTKTTTSFEFLLLLLLGKTSKTNEDNGSHLLGVGAKHRNDYAIRNRRSF